MKRTPLAIAVGFASLLAASVADAAEPKVSYTEQIRRGREYLFRELPKENRVGRLALGTLALQKTAASNHWRSRTDPRIDPFVKRIREHADRGAAAFDGAEGSHYALALSLMVLAHDGLDSHEKTIRALVKVILDRQLECGAWGYPNETAPDTSQTQYMLLALWEAADAGIEIPVSVWDKALLFHIRTQDAAGANGRGGFAYHPDLPTGDAQKDQQETATMGVAGLGSMLICKSMIPALAHRTEDGPDLTEFLRPATEANVAYVVQVKKEMLEKALLEAENWVVRTSPYAGTFNTSGRLFYYLYSLERCVAFRRGSAFKKVDWHGAAVRQIRDRQRPDGSFGGGEYDGIPDTSFAIMFLGQVMQLRDDFKIEFEQLKPTAMSGNRGLPQPVGADGDRTQRPSNVGRLHSNADADETRRLDSMSESAAADHVERLVDDLAQLRSWAKDRRSLARSAAIKKLSRTRNPLVVSLLIEALDAREGIVYSAARDGLQRITRDPEVFGLPSAEKRDPAALKAGIARCREWYASLRIEPSAQQAFGPPNAP